MIGSESRKKCCEAGGLRNREKVAKNGGYPLLKYRILHP